MKVFVMGGGSWGTALAISLLENGHKVNLYMRSVDQLNKIKTTNINERYLKGVYVSPEISLTNDVKDVKGSKMVILAVSSQASRGVMEAIKPYVDEDAIIVNVSKGLERGTGLRISEIAKTVLPNNPFVVLSGPSHAEEVAAKMPTTLVSASEDIVAAEATQDAFSNEFLRLYTNHDVIGVELGGALKNIIALGAGITDGLGYGDNSKAALITRGMVEITRLGTALGADVSTFMGLSGIGDLIVTCTSMHSRNRKAGFMLGKGCSLDEVLKEVDMVVEGIVAAEVAYELSKKLSIELPITTEIYKLLYENSVLEEAVTRLMLRVKKHETEEMLKIKMEQ